MSLLHDIYNTYFQEPYKIQDKFSKEALQKKNNIRDISLYGDYKGKQVFLPVTLVKDAQTSLYIPCATIRISSQKNIIRTVVSERAGTVKEQFNVGDYQIAIKGVLLGELGRFPDKQILVLKDIYQSSQTVEIHNALVELFMGASRKIVITALEFPEVQGKEPKYRPFTLSCESDFIDTLIID